MLSHLQGQEIIRRLVLLLDAQVMGPGAGSPSSSPSHMVGSTHGQSNVRIAASGDVQVECKTVALFGGLDAIPKPLSSTRQGPHIP